MSRRSSRYSQSLVLVGGKAESFTHKSCGNCALVRARLLAMVLSVLGQVGRDLFSARLLM